MLNARDYSDYESWNNELTDIINGWVKLQEDALVLERMAFVMAEERVSYRLITTALAYDKKEISNVFDSAPARKK